MTSARARVRAGIGVLLGGALVFLVGVAAGRVATSRPTASGGADSVPGLGVAGEGPTVGSPRSPVGAGSTGDRSPAGAWAAALAYASAEQTWLYLDDAAIAAAVAGVATPDAAPRLTALVTGGVGLLRDALAASPGPVWWVVQPLAARVEDHRADRARVGVWLVAVLSAADVAVPQSRWVTETIDLRWVDGEWQVDGVSERPGPTPVLDASDEPWLPERLAEALAGFEPLRAEW